MPSMETQEIERRSARRLNTLRGVLVLGPDGKQLAASGIALQPRTGDAAS